MSLNNLHVVEIDYKLGNELLSFLDIEGYLPSFMGFTGTKQYDLIRYDIRSANGLLCKEVYINTDENELLHSEDNESAALDIFDLVSRQRTNVIYKHGKKHCINEPAHVVLGLYGSDAILEARWFVEGKEYDSREHYLSTLGETELTDIAFRTLRGDTF